MHLTRRELLGMAACLAAAAPRQAHARGRHQTHGAASPDAVDIQAVARFARAAGDLTLSLANAPSV